MIAKNNHNSSSYYVYAPQLNPFDLIPGTAWKQASKAPMLNTSHTVSGLMEDMKYTFRVSALNRAGAGPHSEYSSAIKATQPLGM